MTAVSDGKTGLGLEQSLSSAAAFLSPVLTRGKRFSVCFAILNKFLMIAEHLVQARGNSLIDSLISQVPNKNGAHKDPTAAVVNAALSHLRNIHDALIAASGLCEAGQILYNNKSRRTIDGLLDLISVEGIYPALSPGVGIPIERRVKSVFKAGVTARPVLGDINSRQDKDLDLLKEVVEDLSKIALSGNQGVNPALRERTLVDVVCACGDLAYKPSYGNGDENSISIYRHLFNQLLDQYVMPYWKNTFLHPIHRLVM